MFVITLTPIKKGFGLDSLSYFSSTEISVGSIVSVPVRKKIVKALVLESAPALASKAELKSSDFALRKVASLESKPFFSSEWMKSLEETADYFIVSKGELLSALLPALVLKNIEALQVDAGEVKKSNSLGIKEDVRETEKNFGVFQGSDEDRVSQYKTLVREEFAKKKSVFLCLPNSRDQEKAKETFKKGIEKHILVFNTKITPKKLLEQWKLLRESKHPLLIIASPSWLFLPIKNLNLIILDGESSSVWKSMRRPFIDTKKFAEIFASHLGIKLVLGDSVLSVETLSKYKSFDPYAFEFLNFRAHSSGSKSALVDMKKKPEEARDSSIISPLLISLIREAQEKSKHIFIYSTRKGLSSVTVCRDCGTQVTCQNCNSPVVLYKRAGENIFKCHQCGEVRGAQEVCGMCGSWRLLPLGVGVEKVKEEIERIFPNIKIFEINKEATPTSSKAQKISENFYASVSSVLIGTEMAVSFLEEPIDFAAVASIDSLFSIPDFHIREKIFKTIVDIKSKAIEKFLIQVRNAEKDIVELSLGGNILDFYQREIKEREELNYPPFSLFIKIVCRGTKVFVKKEMEKVALIFQVFRPIIFSSSYEKQESEYAENAVLKLKISEWPHIELLSLLRTLPPFFEIKVNPDNLL